MNISSVSILLFFKLLVLNTVISDDTIDQSACIDEYKNINNQPISDISTYCYDKNCIIKCCPEGQIINHIGVCAEAKKFKRLYSKVKYSSIPIYSFEGNKFNKTNKNLINNFERVQNELLSQNNCTYDLISDKFYILEDGTLKVEIAGSNDTWKDVEKLSYCVDYRVWITLNENKTRNVELKFIYRVSTDSETNARKARFIAIGMLVSCFFMLLVLAVYSLLPRLRNIVGMMLMAYVFTLFVTYFLKACQHVFISKFTTDDCKIFSPVLYYFAISSFFWLNIMSFDIWWTFRGTRKSRDIHRRGEFVKFCWYGLFAWGAPLLLTIGAIGADSVKPTTWPNFIRPHFEFCLADEMGVKIYMHVPIGIIIVMNIVLFLMTAENIWIIKYRVSRDPSFRKSKKDENRFGIYIKLSVMMGVSWVIELIPDTRLWLFILLNFCNCFMGVGIFFLFVFKRSILIMLCLRFNMKCKFVEKLQARTQSGTRHTRSSTFKSTTRSVTVENTTTV